MMVLRPFHHFLSYIINNPVDDILLVLAALEARGLTPGCWDWDLLHSLG
jgi:hypothetical protein